MHSRMHRLPASRHPNRLAERPEVILLRPPRIRTVNRQLVGRAGYRADNSVPFVNARAPSWCQIDSHALGIIL